MTRILKKKLRILKKEQRGNRRIVSPPLVMTSFKTILIEFSSNLWKF
jgi:hypothetical protein